jgi:hypothetical protein
MGNNYEADLVRLYLIKSRNMDFSSEIYEYYNE